MLGLVAAFLVYQFLKREAKAGADALSSAVDPTNNDNFFATKTNQVVDIVDNGTKDSSNTLGTWLADWFPSDAEQQANAMIRGDTQP